MSSRWLSGPLLSVCLGLRAATVCCAEPESVDEIVTLLEIVLDADEATARECLGVLTTHLQRGSQDAQGYGELKARLTGRLEPIVADPAHPLHFETALLTATWRDPGALRTVRDRFLKKAAPPAERLAALNALIALRDEAILKGVEQALSTPGNSLKFRGQCLDALGRSDDPRIAAVVLSKYPMLDPELKPRAIELLTQRPVWSQALLSAVEAQQIEKEAINLNQLRRVATFKDESIRTQVQKLYGAIREGRDPNREQVFYRMRDFLNGTPGDPRNGEVIFKKVCAQCHKLYGEGAEVGPDITRNGRNNWDQLLWNVLDPSQVIGPGYQARILITDEGRTLTGLPVEESEEQIVLKVQGGKFETIPRDRIELYKVSELSLMPDQLEKQVSPQELADLLSFLAHDRHPSDPQARLLPGAPSPRR